MKGTNGTHMLYEHLLLPILISSIRRFKNDRIPSFQQSLNNNKPLTCSLFSLIRLEIRTDVTAQIYPHLLMERVTHIS